MPTRTFTSRITIGAAIAASLLVLAAVGNAIRLHWWTRANTVDVAGLPVAERGKPVRLEGSVTYVDEAHQVAVVQDDTGAIAVAMSDRVSPKVGQHVELRGVLPAKYDPMAPLPLALDRPDLTVLKEQVDLPARKISMTEIYGGFE